MTTYHFTAQTLTPVHIGCGKEIDPTEFLLNGDSLVQFNIAQIIDDLTQEERERFSVFLEKADLKEIQNFLRHHVENRHGIPAIGSAQDFQSEFKDKVSNPNNQFKVEMMPRNPHTGQAFIPGSSIKGAIRTALVNHFANLNPETKQKVHELTIRENIKKRAQILEENALNRLGKDTHRDIFRLIHVGDALLPENSTRIDRAANFNPSKTGSENIQIWVERILSRADSATSPEFKVSLRIDKVMMNNRNVRENLGRTFLLGTILKACNDFYWGRMVAEGKRFDGKSENGEGWNTILKTFPQGKLENGDLVSIDPSSPYWNNKEYTKRRVLLRIGRFSHFESLSVDELRQGENAKTKAPITDMGATRTRCIMENGKKPMPFGWIMLTLDEEKDIEDY
jgi:CRISPR-associated protein Csm5